MLLPRQLGQLSGGQVSPRDAVLANYGSLGLKVAPFDPLHVYLWVSPGLLKEVVHGFEAVVSVDDDRLMFRAKYLKWLKVPQRSLRSP